MRFEQLTNLYLQTSSWLQGQIPLLQNLPIAVGTSTFDWSRITPTKYFEWHQCFGDFKCARLQVPMDWQGTSIEASKIVELAVIKVEATVPITDPKYGGAVVLNPGGPGGSGIGQVLRGGHAVRTLLSAAPDAHNDTAKQNFDIIGFDPRGVNNTRPMLTCFPNHIELASFMIESSSHGLMDTTDVAFDYLWASRRAMAEGCSKKAAEEGIAKHMATASVARDIIEIFERHGEWRESEAQRFIQARRGPYSLMSAEERAAIINRAVYNPGEEMVQYWGFSYGTILGGTLATMYPDRVKRAVLDGVADFHDYMAGGWTTNLPDTDLTFVKLAEYCYEGGPKNCALYDEDGPAVIAMNLQNTVAKLKDNPVGIPGNSTLGPQTVTYNDLKLHIRDIVYHPLLNFPVTAQILHELSQGFGATLLAWKTEHLQPSLGKPLSQQCLKDGPYSPTCFTVQRTWDATAGVSCSDGLSRLNETKDEYRAYADQTMAQSQLIGAAWAEIMMPCTAWHARPHWRYDGNFQNKTVHPILFVGNTIDPVTPLRNAFNMAAGFEGSGVLHLDSEGHCTYATTSLCAARAIREYFQGGTLPGWKGGLEDLDGWTGVGALCGTDRVPFDGYVEGVVPPLPEGETDKELWDALVWLNQHWP